LIDAFLLNGKNLENENDDTIEFCDHVEKKDQSSSCCFNKCSSSQNIEENIPDETQRDSMPSQSNQTSFESTNSLDKKVDSFFNSRKFKKNNYLGHFIVLVGYDDNKRLFFYRNPATSKKLSFTSYFNFEIARKSFGTDQDILFIYI
jgi:C1A family cysteine protease